MHIKFCCTVIGQNGPPEDYMKKSCFNANGQLMPDPRSERTYAIMGVYVNSPLASVVL